MQKLNAEIIKEIKESNPIADVVSEFVTLTVKGKNHTGLCPFHNEKTPSFTVYPDSNSFYCFGCGTGGDVIDFVMKINHVDYAEAVSFLANRANVPLPQNENDKALKQKERLYEINQAAAKYYHAHLMSKQGENALDYLKGRNLTLDTIKTYGLGAAPDGWDELLRYLKDQGYSITEMMNAGLIIKNQNGRFLDCFR